VYRFIVGREVINYLEKPNGAQNKNVLRENTLKDKEKILKMLDRKGETDIYKVEEDL